MFQRILAPLILLATLDSAVTQCVPAAIEETAASAAQVQQALAPATEEAEAVAGDDDKEDTRSRENNEHQVSLQQVLKNSCNRFYNRCFWIPWVARASGLRKEIEYSCELTLEKSKRI